MIGKTDRSTSYPRSQKIPLPPPSMTKREKQCQIRFENQSSRGANLLPLVGDSAFILETLSQNSFSHAECSTESVQILGQPTSSLPLREDTM